MSVPVEVSRKPLALALALACLLCAAGTYASLAVDATWSDAVRSWGLAGDLRKAINLSEVFGHSVGAVGVLLAVYCVAVDRRRAIWGAILLTAAAGITANLCKGIIPRVRPHSVDAFTIQPPPSELQPETQPETQLETQAEAQSAAAGATGALPPPPRFWDSRQRSFPSGHAATAWGLAIGLSCVFPRGSGLFVVFASLASLQRVYSGAHYPSDVYAGAAIAFAWGWLFLSIPMLRWLFRPVAPRVSIEE